jgi:hypothetical protein
MPIDDFLTLRRRLTTAVLLLLLMNLPNARAQDQACVTNFSESGSWGSGKEFKTWIEIPGGNRDAVFVAVGQAVAAAGFLGLSANKDLGVVTAYQETNGKKSGVTVMVTDSGAKSLRAEASFRLAPGLRSPADAVRGELCKLVAAALPPDQRAAATASNVLLRRGDQALPLAYEQGAQRTAGGGLAILLFMDYGGSRAEARAAGPRPILTLKGQDDPAKKFLLVKLDSDAEEDRRSVKLGSAGQLIKVGVTGKADIKPDSDWTLPFAATADGPGAWQIKPQKDLAPGEYGLWEIEGFALIPFGVD